MINAHRKHGKVFGMLWIIFRKVISLLEFFMKTIPAVIYSNINFNNALGHTNTFPSGLHSEMGHIMYCCVTQTPQS